VKPISLVWNKTNIRGGFSRNIFNVKTKSGCSNTHYLVVDAREEPLPRKSVVLLLGSNLVDDSPTTGTPSRNPIF